MIELDNIELIDCGFTHSFVKSFATALQCLDKEVTIDEVAVRSGFAFRLIVHKNLCPSAMSVFDWNLLEMGAKNCGVTVDSISRLWHEDDYEVSRREASHNLILKSIDNGIPVVSWDVAVPEWELITGYDLEKSVYKGLSITGKSVNLSFDKLGRREIPILHVLAPVSQVSQKRETVIYNILKVIVDHSEGKEFCETDYADGYKAYKVWIDAMDSIESDDWESRYYLETYTEMRKHAYIYLTQLAKENADLSELSRLYENVYDALKLALKCRGKRDFPNPNLTNEIKVHLTDAYMHEKKAVEEAGRLLK